MHSFLILLMKNASYFHEQKRRLEPRNNRNDDDNNVRMFLALVYSTIQPPTKHHPLSKVQCTLYTRIGV